MAKQIINIGTSVNKGDGDPLRTAFNKINANFTELYSVLGLSDSAFEFTGSTMTTTDSSPIIIDQILIVRSDLTIDGNITATIDGGDAATVY